MSIKKYIETLEYQHEDDAYQFLNSLNNPSIVFIGTYVSWRFIQAHPKIKWDYKFVISENDNITWEIVRDNPNKKWNYSSLSSNPNITWDTVVSKIMTRNVTKYVDPYEQLIPPVLALSFFFIIELFSVVFRYAIFFLAPLIAWVYRKLGLLHITEKTATVQDLDV